VFVRSIPKRTVALIVCEALVILGGVSLAAYVRLAYLGFAWTDGILEKALLIAVVTQVCMYFADLYDFRTLSDRRELFVRSVQALGAASLILAAVYFWLPNLIVGRGVYIVAAGIVIPLLLGWRIIFD